MLSYACYHLLLVPYHLEYLKTLVFILAIATLVQLVEMFMKKAMPSLHKAMGIYLPLITTNCAILGIALINVESNYSFLDSCVNSIGTSIGYTMACSPASVNVWTKRLCPNASRTFPLP